MATAAPTARATATRASLVSPPLPEAASGATTSRFHSRSECSRANSRESVSRSPMRFTAMRKASSSVSPASTSALVWLRRWSSSSSTSTAWIACRRRT